jgi:hypothetical protein
MKKFLLLLIIFLAAACQVFAAEDENTNTSHSFRAYCKTEMAKVLDTYKGEQYSVVYKESGKKPEHWKKTSESVDPAYDIEIQKSAGPGETETGILIVKHSTAFYADNYDSEEAAKEETTVVNSAKNVYKFFMSYENKEWVLTKVMKYTHWQKKKWHTMPPTSVFEILQSRNEVKQ